MAGSWSGPCKTEIAAIQAEYAKGTVDSRVGILNTMPVAMDPSFKMGAYFTKAAVPFNLLIDLKTMQIYFSQTGGDLSNVGKQIQTFFSGPTVPNAELPDDPHTQAKSATGSTVPNAELSPSIVPL